MVQIDNISKWQGSYQNFKQFFHDFSMTLPTSSPEFSMIFLKISETFLDNVGGKYRAEGRIRHDRRSLPYTAGGLGAL